MYMLGVAMQDLLTAPKIGEIDLDDGLKESMVSWKSRQNPHHLCIGKGHKELEVVHTMYGNLIENFEEAEDGYLVREA